MLEVLLGGGARVYRYRLQDKAGAVDLPRAGGRGYDIELRDVSFGYREEHPILQVRAKPSALNSRPFPVGLSYCTPSPHTI